MSEIRHNFFSPIQKPFNNTKPDLPPVWQDLSQIYFVVIRKKLNEFFRPIETIKIPGVFKLFQEQYEPYI